MQKNINGPGKREISNKRFERDLVKRRALFPAPQEGRFDMDFNCKLFAEKFVVKRWQERFCFELKKKPGKLHDRVIKNYEQIFMKEALNDSPKNGIPESKLIYIIDWGNTFTEMTWGNFLRDYPRNGEGFLAISFDGTFGFLETHCSHPKYSKEWYIY